MYPYRPAAISSTASDPKTVHSARSKLVGLPPRGDAAEPGLAVGDLFRRGDEPGPLLPGALRRDDQGEVLARVLTLLDLGADALIRERDLRDQDHVGAAGDPGIQRDPARVAAHDLQHDHPVVA